LNSARYPVYKDQSGSNFNNYFDPLRLNYVKKVRRSIPTPVSSVKSSEKNIIWNAKIGASST
jgi:hypothetical protein